MKYHLGQNISEYALVLGLVVIVAIGALSVLGEQTSGLLGNTIGKRKGPAPVRFALAGSPLVNEPDVVIEGANGQKIVISGYPTTNQAFAELVDQSGSNGSEILAQLFRQIASIKDPTLISQQERDFLMELSNSTFELAQAQKLLDNNLKTTGVADVSGDGNLSSLDLLNFINRVSVITRKFAQTSDDGIHFNHLSIEQESYRVKLEQKSRDPDEENQAPLFQFKNPQIRELIHDTLKKVVSSGASSLKLTLNEFQKQHNNQRAISSGATLPSLTQEDIENNYKRNQSLIKNSILQSLEGSDTICSNSETGVSDLNKLACIKKG